MKTSHFKAFYYWAFTKIFFLEHLNITESNVFALVISAVLYSDKY